MKSVSFYGATELRCRSFPFQHEETAPVCAHPRVMPISTGLETGSEWNKMKLKRDYANVGHWVLGKRISLHSRKLIGMYLFSNWS